MSVKFGHFRLGLRTIKTALAVMICIIFFNLTGRGTPMIAALAAVFSLRQDITTSVAFGKSRLIGNTIGGLLAVVYFAIQSSFKNQAILEVILVPLFVIIIIVISDGIDNNLGIIGGVATMLVIILTVPQEQSVSFAFARLLDTFIGTFIAFGVNFLFKPQKVAEIEEIDANLVKLEEQEAELQKLRAELETYKKPKND